MPILISLLRGVNVGGAHKIKMDTLREIYTNLGMRDVQTYIQSGNVVCRAPKITPTLPGQIEAAIEQACGFRPEVVLRTVEQFTAILAANPFAANPAIEPNKLHVHFLRSAPGPQAATLLEKIPRKNEEIHLIHHEVFVYYPDGIGQSKITAAAFDRALHTRNTGRNWNTVTKLHAIATTLAGV